MLVPGENQGSVFYVAVRPHTNLFLETVARYALFVPDSNHKFITYLETLVSHKVFIKSFRKSLFPHQSAYLCFTLVMIMDKWTDLCGN